MAENTEVPEQTESSLERECGNCGDGIATAHCIDCEEYICDKCQEGHKTFKALKTHCINSLPQDQENSNCPIHPQQATTLFCEDCKALICDDCANDHHQGHKYSTEHGAFSKNRAEIRTVLKTFKKSVSKAEKNLKFIESRQEEITQRSAMLEFEIKGEIEQLKGVLDQLEYKRIGELNKFTQEKIQTLNEQKIKAEIIQKDLSRVEQSVETKLKNVKHVIQAKEYTISEITEHIAKHEEDAIQPEVTWNFELKRDEKQPFLQACDKLFEIIETDILCIENSHILGSENGLEGATIGKTSTVMFEAQTKKKSSYEGSLELRAELVHVKSKKTQMCIVTKQQHGPHSIDYCPMNRGMHELRVTANEIPIKGSPFQVDVPLSPQCFGRPTGTEIESFGPSGVTVDNQGQLVVIHNNGKFGSVLTTDGANVRTFGGTRPGDGHPSGAFGVTVDKDNYIYVADCGNNRIQKFDLEGVLVSKVGTSGSGKLQFNRPVDICFNHHDNYLYVVDSNNHRIQVLSTELEHKLSIGTKGTRSENLKNPRCIALDSHNHLYVSDHDNNCVKVFTTEGKLLRSIEQKSLNDKLRHPYGLAIDSNDTVYVSENGPSLYGPHYVSVFKAEGSYITTFGGNGTERTQFKQIFGMAVDHNDSLVVADKGNNRLKMFK